MGKYRYDTEHFRDKESSYTKRWLKKKCKNRHCNFEDFSMSTFVRVGIYNYIFVNFVTCNDLGANWQLMEK